MVDLLVRLYALPEKGPVLEKIESENIVIRRAHPSEADQIIPWVLKHFDPKWAAECRGALQNRPPTCFVATQPLDADPLDHNPYNLPPERLLGFACYDTVAKGMFGPEGVHSDDRGRGIGAALLMTCMNAMLDAGYAYAVIAWAGPVEFYQKTVGATRIEASEPGIFRGPMVADS